jgi:adenylate kinase
MRQKNKNNLVFIGGIHGVGKGSICRKICEETNFIHLVASDLLKWGEISDGDNKNVKDIETTQDRLILGLKRTIERNKHYLLDGHFCLFNSKGEVERIPKETFVKINPKLIVIVTHSVNKIQERLNKRDGKIYNLELLNKMQTMEVDYANLIASTLNIPSIEIKGDNYQPILKLIK